MNLLSNLCSLCHRSSMGLVLLYLSMFSGFKPNQYEGNIRRKNIYLHVLLKILLINYYGQIIKKFPANIILGTTPQKHRLVNVDAAPALIRSAMKQRCFNVFYLRNRSAPAVNC